MAHILIVQDEPRLRKMIADYLKSKGFTICEAGDGIAAEKRFALEQPDLVILDIMLPGRDGITVLQHLRQTSETPVIMLTAKSEEEDKLKGLEFGADDYITKPFSLKELTARVQAVLRRSGPASGTGRVTTSLKKQTITIQDITMDLTSHIVFLKGKEVHVTPLEFSILQLFMEHPGQVFDREKLLAHVFTDGMEYLDRTVDVHIKNLRKIIEPNNGKTTYIRTVWGVGYRFAAPEELA